MQLSEFQDVLRRTYIARDRQRGADGTFRWLAEEVGEVARTLRSDDPAARHHEFGDALAWLASLANVVGVDLEAAAGRFAAGCPTCGEIPCACPMR